MLYSLVKQLMRIALMVFYRDIKVSGTEKLPTDKPIVLVANHPNTLMDPLVLGLSFKQPLYFLAKSTLFSNFLVDKLLTILHAIPVARAQDATGKVDNKAAFAKSYEFLASKGTLLIFPEGTSFLERKLRKVKTGAARIALGAAAEYDFGLNVAIVPVGINYSDARRFRSKVFVNIGEPLYTDSYKRAYLHNEKETVLSLTENIRKRLEDVLVVIENEKDEQLIEDLKHIFGKKLSTEFDIKSKGAEKDFVLLKGLTEGFCYLQQHNPKLLEQIRVQVQRYNKLADSLGYKPTTLGKPAASTVFSGFLLLVLGFPFYLLGLLFNYIPYKIPGMASVAITKEPEYYATIMLGIGLFTFPIYYALSTWVLASVLPLWIALATLVLAMPATGFFVLYYYRFLAFTLRNGRLALSFSSKKNLAKQLRQERKLLAETMNKASSLYIAAIVN